ncbi:hypothetical protein [Arsukibacterium sp.]|uniref:hypothetical protein n=1 Tax=Arsukibacterium sp. TaxID=1977258 RepID=UPI001BD3A058|nr:hypothetical protein [Arsukibacterium sp.]
MFEYQEWQGMLYGVFSLLLIIGIPVLINRLLHITYPKAIFMLFASCIIFMAVDRLIHSLIFNIAIKVDPLNDFFGMLVPVYVFVSALVVDVIAMSWQRIKKRQSSL